MSRALAKRRHIGSLPPGRKPKTIRALFTYLKKDPRVASAYEEEEGIWVDLKNGFNLDQASSIHRELEPDRLSEGEVVSRVLADLDSVVEDPKFGLVKRRRARMGLVRLPSITRGSNLMWWLFGGGVLLAGVAFLMRNKIVSALRTPQSILDAVAEVDPENNPDLQRGAPPAPKATDTWCNKAVAWITAKLGTPIPFDTWGTLANAQIAWLAAGNDGWYEINDMGDAQAAALAGKVVVVTYSNPNGPGHIAIVLPIVGDTLQIAQAGATNFNQGSLAQGFGSLPIRFFAHS